MKSIVSVASVALALAIAAPAGAAEPQEPGKELPSQLPSMRVDEIKDMEVVNDKGEVIGDVGEIVRHKEDSKLFAVVGVGGFLGIGEHDVLIPLQDLSIRGDRLQAPAGTTKDQLKELPEFDEDDKGFQKLREDEMVTIGSRTHRGGGSR